MNFKSIILHLVVIVNVCALVTFLCYRYSLNGWDITAYVIIMLTSAIIIFNVLGRLSKCVKAKPFKFFLNGCKIFGGVSAVAWFIGMVLFFNYSKQAGLEYFVSLEMKILALQISAYLCWLAFEIAKEHEFVLHTLEEVRVATNTNSRITNNTEAR